MPFIAIDVLRFDEGHRDVHDLESFFWVFVWMCLKYQGPNHDPADLKAQTVTKQRFATLTKLLKCNTLDDGGSQKLGVLADCKNALRLADAIDPYWHKIIPWLRKLAVVISNGRSFDEAVRNGDPPTTVDERSHAKFLEILRDAYDSLPENDEDDTEALQLLSLGNANIAAVSEKFAKL